VTRCSPRHRTGPGWEDVAAILGPDHDVEVYLVVGGRRKTLVAASAAADLLVGAPRRPEASTWPWQLRPSGEGRAQSLRSRTFSTL